MKKTFNIAIVGLGQIGIYLYNEIRLKKKEIENKTGICKSCCLCRQKDENIKRLSTNVTVPISMWDERLSSEGSFKITKELGTNVSNRIDKLDKNAAAFILQGAIDYLSN